MVKSLLDSLPVVSTLTGTATSVIHDGIDYVYTSQVPFLNISGKEDITDFAIQNDFVSKIMSKVISKMSTDKVLTTGEGFSGQSDVFENIKFAGKTLYQHFSDSFNGLDPIVASKAYLLRVAVCYVEVPNTRIVKGSAISGYTKFLATTNYRLAENWVSHNTDTTLQVVKNPVIKKFQQGTFTSNPIDLQPYVKLTYDNRTEEFKISNPRSGFDFTTPGIRVTPLFYVKGIADFIKSHAEQGYLGISYYKDGGEVRDLVTSMDVERVNKIYKGTAHEDNFLSSTYTGDMFECLDTLSRGYARFPSIGESVFDNSITRSISLTRIKSFDSEALPDISNIYTNVEMVTPTFLTTIHRLEAEGSGLIITDIIRDLNELGILSYIIPSNHESVAKWIQSALYTKGSKLKYDLADYMSTQPALFEEFARANNQGTTIQVSDKPKRHFEEPDDLGLF